MRRGKYLELLDFPRFAWPSVLDVNVATTARNARERMQGKAFLAYGPLWPRVSDLTSGRVTDELIQSTFSYYQDEWKNENLRSAFRLLRDLFGDKGTWYPAGRKPRFVLGVWFKPSIRGIWFFEGKAYAVLINARKGQPLSREDVIFLARSVYELHCIDDPNNPIPLIVDLSKHSGDEARKLRVYPVLPEEASSLEIFEQSVRHCLDALSVAGITLPPPEVEHILDLFRR